VKSASSPEAFQLFLELLQGKAIDITQPTYKSLSSLSQEFGFAELSEKVAEFRGSPAFSQNDDQSWISFLEEQITSYERRLMDLETHMASYEQRLERLEAGCVSENDQLESVLERVGWVEAAVSELRSAVAGHGSGQVSEVAHEVELLKQKVSEIDLIRADLGAALGGISLLAAVQSKNLAQFQGQLNKTKYTFATTGRKFVFQSAWSCRTCGLVDRTGCCAACALICHDGHDVRFYGCPNGGFFCDCGAGDAPRPCRCLK
jgi:uncharacterized coiled-coil protein SlyX